VEETTVTFLGTKVEIKLKKAESGSWAKLDFPRKVIEMRLCRLQKLQLMFIKVEVATNKKPKEEDIDDDVTVQVEALDLDDLEVPVRRAVLSNEASNGRTGQSVI